MKDPIEPMQYISTRGQAPTLSFSETLLAGLANDGGLYVPSHWPQLADLTTATSYVDHAVAIMQPFVDGDIDRSVFAPICAEAYATFADDEVTPLVDLGDNHYLLELFHGPTLAFKDIALQLVGRLFDHVLAERNERVTIVGATSGDTGSAAIDGVKNCDNVDIIILYPDGRTSEVQRRQMTTVASPNVHTVAVDGNFDDCQSLVKAMFADEAFRKTMRLSAVNSINWARVMAQVVYYVAAARRFDQPVTFSVPTGNFGNVLAGWIARQMGANIDQFVLASNSNDILTRFVNDNDMSAQPVVPTLSPSMDIQISSNFERLLFEMNDRDGAVTAEQLHQFSRIGRLTIEDDQRAEFIDGSFRAARFDDEKTIAEMARVHQTNGRLIDPHTATGTAAAREAMGPRPAGPVVTLATAHPAKFPDAVERATGVRPALPAHLTDLFERPERIVRRPNDLVAVQDFIRSVGRA